MAVSKRLRFEVLRRDNHACRYCGGTAPEAKLTVDHVVPTALGGSDEPTNLVAACSDCNSGKSSSNPDAALVGDVSADAIRWAQAVAAAAEHMDAQQAADRDIENQFLRAWKEWGHGPAHARECVPLDSNWKESVAALLKRGLPIGVVVDCVGIAMRRKGVDDKFRYFCGVAWRKVDELTEAAKTIYDRGGASESHGLQLPDPAKMVLAPYRDAVRLLYGVVPDAFLDGTAGLDGDEFRSRLATEFDAMYSDDGDGKESWPSEIKALVAMVGRMREFMDQEANV